MNIKQLRAQIAALQALTIDENKNFRSANYDKGKFDALSAVDALLNSLQEEPVSEELEKFARANANKEYPPEHEMADDNWKQRAGFVKGVKAGAKWKEEEMMAKAKSGTVQKDNQVILDDGTYIDLDPSMQLKPSFVGLKEGDRIKVIVIKGD